MRLFILVLSLGISLSAPVLTFAQDVATGPNAHAWEMFHLFRTMTKGNFCFSPYSGHRVAAMLTEGARGDTQKQLLALSHLPDDSAKRLSDSQTLSDGLRKSAAGGGFLLEVANSIWAPSPSVLEPAYVSMMKERLGADLQLLPGADAVANAAKVNRWIRDKTRGRITDMVGPQTFQQGAGTVLAVNAVFLKAAWADRFDPRLTKPRAFTTASNHAALLPIMARRGTFSYAEAPSWQCLEMPLASPDFSMLFLLPRTDVTLESLEVALKPETWAKIVSGLNHPEVNVWLPRFSFSTQVDIQGLWQKLGVEAAFDPGKSDLTGITPRKPCYVGQVLHEATIEVNEFGAEASAAMVAADPFGPAAPEPPKPVPLNFIATHPFLWFAVHKPSGLILFMGRFAGE